jgi:hypothetical protein
MKVNRDMNPNIQKVTAGPAELSNGGNDIIPSPQRHDGNGRRSAPDPIAGEGLYQE